MKKMRVSNHNARMGKNGVFSPKHNDRNFNLEVEHIDENKSKNNSYWMVYDCKNFEECEKEFYKNNFSNALEKKNEKHIKSRHKERIKTIDDYRTSPLTCPEETLYYIGDKSNTVDTNILQEIIQKQLEWESEEFPDVKYLNIAIHRDEEGADHIHARKVYIAPDENGDLIVNQTKALANMGIERPDTSKPSSKFNNAKMTYTKLVREHFIELCKEYGLEIETEPKEKSKTGYSLEEYKLKNQEETFLNNADKKEKEFQALQDKLEAQDRANKDLQKSLDAREEALNDRESDLTERDRELQVKQKECDTKQSEALQAKKKYEGLTLLREKDLKAVQDKLEELEKKKNSLEEKEKNITELYNKMDSLYKDMQTAKENDSLENWARANTITVRQTVNGELKPVKITYLQKYEIDKKRQSVGAQKKVSTRFDEITKQYDNRWHTPNLNDFQA